MIIEVLLAAYLLRHFSESSRASAKSVMYTPMTGKRRGEMAATRN